VGTDGGALKDATHLAARVLFDQLTAEGLQKTALLSILKADQGFEYFYIN